MHSQALDVSPAADLETDTAVGPRLSLLVENRAIVAGHGHRVADAHALTLPTEVHIGSAIRRSRKSKQTEDLPIVTHIDALTVLQPGVRATGEVALCELLLPQAC